MWSLAGSATMEVGRSHAVIETIRPRSGLRWLQMGSRPLRDAERSGLARWDRRRFIAVMTALLAAPFVAEAQESGKMARVGILSIGPAPTQGDLVAAGLVNSLAKPRGNIAGSQLLGEELVSKRLQFLKALVPNLSKVAPLREDVTTSVIPEIPTRYDQRAVTAARALDLTLQIPPSLLLQADPVIE